MTRRTTGIILVVGALLAALAQAMGWSVPVLKLPFIFGNKIFGYGLVAAAFLVGFCWALRGGPWQWNPTTIKKWQRFRSIRRGYIAFLLLLVLAVIAMLDTALVGKRALIVRYEGKTYFPFVQPMYSGKTFGLDYEAEADYRELKKKWKDESSKNWLILPLVPYDSRLDSPPQIMTVVEKNGVAYIEGSDEPFNGRAYTSFIDKPSQKRQEFIFRRGIKNGEMRGWDEKNVPIEKGRYENGQLVNYTEFQPGSVAQASAQGTTTMKTLLYPPNSPSLATRHFLGTNSSGIDVLAVLFGGWQQMLMAALLFVVLIFAIGVTIGGVLGYFGGWIDLMGQRFLEIWSVLPFLFIVIIINSLITPTFATVVIVLAIFGWVGTAEFFRTATYKERERDYVAAARLQGASTPRIIFRHVLPNVIAILITLAPFQIVGVISSISALDFLGFGLPPDLPSWGRLLQEGTDNFNAPWIVGSAFVAIVITLLIFTFIGEAIREAFDPKKFTRYE